MHVMKQMNLRVYLEVYACMYAYTRGCPGMHAYVDES
jgi:hypothetical protein